jgi:protein involved in polysaccharide export with SLBB domain
MRRTFLFAGLLFIVLSSLSCVRLRGRPPVEEEPPPPGEIAREEPVEEQTVSVEEMMEPATGEEGIIPAVPERPLLQPAQTGEYRLGYGDVLSVKFFYDPELDQTVTIRPDGRITLPRLGDILVVGMTPSQLDELITAQYAEIIRDPEVAVIVEEIGEEVVYVLGEVNQPGGYPLNAYGTTVMGAIALAEGFKNTAKLSSVILISRDASGAPRPERLNLTRAVSGNREDDPYLRGSEIVYVPSTFIAQLNLFMEQFFTNMMPPMDFYLKGYDVLNPEARRWSP